MKGCKIPWHWALGRHDMAVVFFCISSVDLHEK